MNFNNKVEVHERKPEGFTPTVEIAACYLEYDKRLLLLQRSSGQEPGSWGVPAGKLEKGETAEIAAKRELFEETGIQIEAPSNLRFVGSLYIRKPSIDYVYHQFRVLLTSKPDIRLSEEHRAFLWATQKELEKLPLMDGARDVLHFYKNYSPNHLL